MYHLAPIADNVVVAVLVAIQALLSALLILSLPPRRREETLFALSSASYTWWVSGIIDTAQVAFHFAAPTWSVILVSIAQSSSILE